MGVGDCNGQNGCLTFKQSLRHTQVFTLIGFLELQLVALTLELLETA